MTLLRHWGHRVSAALTAALFAALLLSFSRVDHVPVYVSAAVFALAVLAATRPQTALLLVAAVVPVAFWVGRHWQPSASWAEVIVVSFAAGYCSRAVFVAHHSRTPLDVPIFLSVLVIIASLAVQLLVDGWRIGGDAVRAYLWQLLAGDYFVSSTGTDPVDVAMRLLESLLLVRAASAITMSESAPAFPLRFARCFVIGAALAGALNVTRIWEGASRLDAPLATFLKYVMTVRLNVHFVDLNAAGSYFVMALFPAIALILLPRGTRWIVPALLVAAGAWIAGSRAAYVSGLLAVALPIGLTVWRANRRGATLALAGSAIVLALAAGSLAYFLPHRGNQQSIVTAAQVRWELMRTSVRMLASRPAFGVGLGQYSLRSGEFSSPALLTLFPPARRENAHNNFLQILSELGLVGFAAVGWVLWRAGSQCLRLLQVDPRDPLRTGIVVGALSFVISWLGGHPLLIDEPAFTFWTLLGVAVGWGSRVIAERGDGVERRVAAPPTLRQAQGRLEHRRKASESERGWAASARAPASSAEASRRPGPASTEKSERPLGWLVVAAVLVIVASIPFRVQLDRANGDLEHRGIGLSTWRDDIDGVRYRLAGAASTVFVPSGAQWATIPLRAVQAGADITVELRLDGDAIDAVKVPPDRWYTLRLILPRDGDPPRYRRLDLHVRDVSTADPQVLMIGKVEPR